LLAHCFFFALPAAAAAQSSVQAVSGTSPTTALPVAVCSACHGNQGAGSESVGAPRLAGMNRDYLAHALTMFKNKTRASDIMQPVAQKLSDDQITALSDYFSAQNPVVEAATHAPAADLVANGKRLAESGGEGDVPACFSCHGPSGQGNGARFPAIAGQPMTFSIARLREFQMRAKSSVPKAGSMTEVASKMDDAQIEAAAAYFSVARP
jgi:cytochrome c553